MTPSPLPTVVLLNAISIIFAPLWEIGAHPSFSRSGEEEEAWPWSTFLFLLVPYVGTSVCACVWVPAAFMCGLILVFLRSLNLFLRWRIGRKFGQSIDVEISRSKIESGCGRRPGFGMRERNRAREHIS